MKIPLQLKLRKEVHKKLAYAQDLLVLELYHFFSKPVLHGGTSLWRCYSGNRFSEDIDIYLPESKKGQVNEFLKTLEKKGFKTEKVKFTKQTAYSKLAYEEMVLRFEVFFKEIKNFILKEFELIDGSFTNVYTLKAENLLLEKIHAFKQRKKIRDLCDVVFLLGIVKKDKEITDGLKKLISTYKKPKDWESLQAFIISGPVPSPEKLIEYIKRWVK